MVELEDLNGETLRGGFYPSECQIITFNPEPRVVDEVLKTRIRKGRKQNLVSFSGYSAANNTWVDA